MYVFNDHCWWLNHLGFNLMTCNGGNSGSTQPTNSFADYHLHAVAVYYHQGAVQQPIGLSLLLLLVLQPVAETGKL